MTFHDPYDLTPPEGEQEAWGWLHDGATDPTDPPFNFWRGFIIATLFWGFWACIAVAVLVVS